MSFCLFCSAQTAEQIKRIDSSLVALKNLKQDTNRVLLLNKIIGIYRYAKQYDKESDYLKEMLELSKKLNYKKGINYYHFEIGYIQHNTGKLDEALVNLNIALSYFEAINDKKQMALLYGVIGRTYYRQELFPKSLEYFLKTVKMYEILGDKKAVAGYAGNVGAIYNATGDNKKALEFYEKALKVNVEINAERGEAINLVCISNVYNEQKKFDLAEKYAQEALVINKKLGDQEYIANNYGCIGVIKLNSGADYEGALDYLTRSMLIYEDIKDERALANNLNNIGSVNYKMKNYIESEKHLLRSLEIATRLNLPKLKKEAYIALSTLYGLTGKYKESLEYYKESTRLKDSLFGLENQKVIVQKQLEFDFEKKEALTKAEFIKQQSLNQVEIEKRKQAIILLEKDNALRKLDLTQTNLQLKEKEAESESQKKQVELLNKDRQLQTVEAQKKAKELEQQKQLRNIFIAGAILLLGFVVFILFTLNKSKRNNKIIERQKAEVEQQKHLVEEKHREITDSINYAERIQRSFLAAKETLDENLKDYFIFFKPKDVVSGDFYWAGKLNDGNFALVTADSTGHGVPGAIMSLLNITSLENAIEHHTKPSDIFNATRTTIIKRLQKDGSKEGGKDGMDASLTVYDLKNKKLFTAAANSAIWLVRNNEVIEINFDKMPLGKHDLQHISFSQQETDLQTGDVIYTLTDGFADQFGGTSGKKFMSKKLRELLAANAHMPMQKQKELLENTFKDWVGNLEQVDDVTLIGVRV